VFVFVTRLLQCLTEDTTSIELKIECVDILSSLSKGPDHIVHCVVDSGTLPILLKGLSADCGIVLHKDTHTCRKGLLTGCQLYCLVYVSIYLFATFSNPQYKMHL